MQLLKETKHRLALEIEGEEHEQELPELRRKHEEELKQAKLEAENGAFRHALASSRAGGAAIPSHKLAKLSRDARKSLSEIKPKKLIRHRLSEIVPVWIRLKTPAIATVEIPDSR